MEYIANYQKLSNNIIQELKLTISVSNWLYKDKEYKMKKIKDCGLYEIDGDYIIAYKSTKKGGVSTFNSAYKYQVGGVYESLCDCDTYYHNSFGLSAWTENGALEHFPYGELYKVKIHIDDVGALVDNLNKIRCFKLEILERIK